MGEIEAMMLRTSQSTDVVLGVLIQEIKKLRVANPEMTADEITAFIEKTRADAQSVTAGLRREAQEGI